MGQTLLSAKQKKNKKKTIQLQYNIKAVLHDKNTLKKFGKEQHAVIIITFYSFIS